MFVTWINIIQCPITTGLEAFHIFPCMHRTNQIFAAQKGKGSPLENSSYAYDAFDWTECSAMPGYYGSRSFRYLSCACTESATTSLHKKLNNMHTMLVTGMSVMLRPISTGLEAFVIFPVHAQNQLRPRCTRKLKNMHTMFISYDLAAQKT